tara:strand:+ start:35124 stop:35315 length:192 start_codon:yes stop_codon:yes gene_type:complete
MPRKQWQVIELQNLLAMIMEGFKINDMAKALCCTKYQIRHAVKYNFRSSVMFIRMKYKIEVIK